MVDANNLFCLKWSNFQKNVSTELKKIQMDQDLVDITFVCGEGESFGAHKLVLFACSPYLKRLLKVNPCSHPIFYMNGVKQEVLKAILDYMYLGEVRINQDDLQDFLRVAEEFKIRGVTPDCNASKQQSPSTCSSDSNSSTRNNTKRPRSALSSTGHSAKSTERSDQMFFNQHGEEAPSPSGNIELKTELSEFHDETALSTNEPNPLQYSESMRSDASIPMDDGYEGNENNQPTIDDCNESWIHDEKQHPFSNTSPNSTETDKNFKLKPNSGKAQCLVPSSCPSCHRVYSNISNLRQHIRLIHNPMSVNCPICNKTFNSNLYLKRHYLSMHSSSNSNSGTTTTTDLKTDNIPTSNTTATIPSSSNMAYQEMYSKRVGSIHDNLNPGNTTSNVSQQHDMKLNSTWNPYTDLNHTM